MTTQKTLLSMIVAVIAATIPSFPMLESRASDERRVVIEIQSFEFRLETPVVKPGDVIVWVNKDIVPHTATARDGSWDSGLIESGGEWEMVVTADMTQAYYCTFHPTMTAELDIESD